MKYFIPLTLLVSCLSFSGAQTPQDAADEDLPEQKTYTATEVMLGTLSIIKTLTQGQELTPAYIDQAMTTQLSPTANNDYYTFEGTINPEWNFLYEVVLSPQKSFSFSFIAEDKNNQNTTLTQGLCDINFNIVEDRISELGLKKGYQSFSEVAVRQYEYSNNDFTALVVLANQQNNNEPACVSAIKLLYK